MIIYDNEGIGIDEYENILYDSVFSLIDDLLAIPDEVEEVQIAEENAFVFMQDNAPCHKVATIMEFLEENRVLVIQ